jgi:hypothetical protein
LNDTALLVGPVWFRMTLDHIARFDNGLVFSGKDLDDPSGKALVVARYYHNRIIFSQT